MNKTKHSHEDENAIIFWGNKFENEKTILSSQAINKLYFCQQIHSNLMIAVNKNKLLEADAHYTKDPSTALAIKTADCLPIMISSKNYVFAIHAGWRGLEKKILYNLEKFKLDESYKAYIGPHIQKESYEVDHDVAFKIINSSPVKNKDFLARPHGKNKFLVNLAQVAKDQLMHLGFAIDNICVSPVNTFTHTDWNSYRRDGKLAGRNLSLIYLK